MLPTVGFTGHDNGVVRSVMNYAAAGIVGHVRKRIVGLVAAAPNFFCGACCNFTDPNGPGMRAVGFDEITFGSIARHGRPPNERDAFAVKRPLRSGIAVHRRSDELYGFVFEVVDTDEAVVISR